MKYTVSLPALLLISMTINAQEGKTENSRMDRIRDDSSVSIEDLKEGRGRLFDQGNYAMFIHWGLYSHLGGIWKDTTYYGIGEWIMNPRMAGIPVNEYKEIAREFNPDEFDARSIAQLAKDAGMKYIIITSKHH